IEALERVFFRVDEPLVLERVAPVYVSRQRQRAHWSVTFAGPGGAHGPETRGSRGYRVRLVSSVSSASLLVLAGLGEGTHVRGAQQAPQRGPYHRQPTLACKLADPLRGHVQALSGLGRTEVLRILCGDHRAPFSAPRGQ